MARTNFSFQKRQKELAKKKKKEEKMQRKLEKKGQSSEDSGQTPETLEAGQLSEPAESEGLAGTVDTAQGSGAPEPA